MRVALVAVIVPALLVAADIRIDHVTVAGTNVKALQERLAAVGIPSVYGGPHSNHTTEMALVSLPDGSYLELMGIQPNADPQAADRHEWARFLKANAGPCAWAVREPDIAAEVKRLAAAGIPVAAPVKSGRERPDGVRLEWQTSEIAGATRGTFFPFLIQDFTPRDQRVFPQGQPTTQDFKGIARVVIGVKNLEAAVQRYRKAYSLPAPVMQADKQLGLQLAIFDGTPVVLAQPLTQSSWLTERLRSLGESPIAFVLSASDSSHYSAVSHSRWGGFDISWLDDRQLGWHLGIEKARQ